MRSWLVELRLLSSERPRGEKEPRRIVGTVSEDDSRRFKESRSGCAAS